MEMVEEFLGENPVRVWSCGPSGFNRLIANMLEEAGYPRGQFMLL